MQLVLLLFRGRIGLAVLELLENGKLIELHKKWWYEKGECRSSDKSVPYITKVPIAMYTPCTSRLNKLGNTRYSYFAYAFCSKTTAAHFTSISYLNLKCCISVLIVVADKVFRFATPPLRHVKKTFCYHLDRA